MTELQCFPISTFTIIIFFQQVTSQPYIKILLSLSPHKVDIRVAMHLCKRNHIQFLSSRERLILQQYYQHTGLAHQVREDKPSEIRQYMQ